MSLRLPSASTVLTTQALKINHFFYAYSPSLVIITASTSSATSENKFGIIMNHSFQWGWRCLLESFWSSVFSNNISLTHDDVIKWKHFPCYWPFVRGIHRLLVNSTHKGQWRKALMFSLICIWINGWVNNLEAGDLRRYRAHCGVTVMNVQNVQWDLKISPGTSYVLSLSAINEKPYTKLIRAVFVKA